jgi:hypothetical protein
MTFPSFSAGEVLTATDMNAVGLWLVTSRTSTGATQQFNNVFTSDYRNYKIIITTSANSSSVDVTARMRVGGVDTAGTGYSTGGYRAQWSASGAVSALYDIGTSSFFMGRLDNTLAFGMCSVELFNPQNAQITSFNSQFMDNSFLGNRIGRLADTTQYDGISIFLSATWAGTISIYGYRN